MKNSISHLDNINEKHTQATVCIDSDILLLLTIAKYFYFSFTSDNTVVVVAILCIDLKFNQ